MTVIQQAKSNQPARSTKNPLPALTWDERQDVTLDVVLDTDSDHNTLLLPLETPVLVTHPETGVAFTGRIYLLAGINPPVAGKRAEAVYVVVPDLKDPAADPSLPGVLVPAGQLTVLHRYAMTYFPPIERRFRGVWMVTTTSPDGPDGGTINDGEWVEATNTGAPLDKWSLGAADLLIEDYGQMKRYSSWMEGELNTHTIRWCRVTDARVNEDGRRTLRSLAADEAGTNGVTA